MSDRREGAAAAAKADAAGTADAQPVPPMFTEAQLRRLKAAVIIMGIVLILGFGVVIFRIVHLLQRAGPAPAATLAAPAGARPDVTLALPEGAVVRQVTASGDRLVVHYDAPSGGGVSIVDLATGAVQRVHFGRAGGGR